MSFYRRSSDRRLSLPLSIIGAIGMVLFWLLGLALSLGVSAGLIYFLWQAGKYFATLNGAA